MNKLSAWHYLRLLLGGALLSFSLSGCYYGDDEDSVSLGDLWGYDDEDDNGEKASNDSSAEGSGKSTRHGLDSHSGGGE